MPGTRRRAAVGVLAVLALSIWVSLASGTPSGATATNFSASAGTPFSGRVATFEPSSKSGDPTPYSATVAWGDGQSSAGQIVVICGDCDPPFFEVRGTHTYANPGTYQTTVTISENGSGSSIVHGTATVGGQGQPPPAPGVTTASFAEPPIARPKTPTTFNASTSTGEGLSYAWDFDGDGSFETSTGSNPRSDHVFPKPGDVHVGVRVTGSKGGAVTHFEDVHVAEPPTARAVVPRKMRRGRAVRFSLPTTTDPKARVAYYRWNFGDRKPAPRKIGGFQFRTGAGTTHPAISH